MNEPMTSTPPQRTDRSDRSRRADVGLFTDVQGTLLELQDVLGRKWAPIVVYRLLADGPVGFTSLKDQVDEVSSKMLSETLADLEDTGLVTRTVVSDRPVRVEYNLTERGQALEPIVTEMIRWGRDHARTVEHGPEGNTRVKLANGDAPDAETRSERPRDRDGQPNDGDGRVEASTVETRARQDYRPDAD